MNQHPARRIARPAPSLAARLARLPVILAILAGCTQGPASEQPAKGTQATEKAAASPKQPAQLLAANEVAPAKKPAAPAKPDSPARPASPNPIEDPPVIGTPQEVFNFPRPPLQMPKVLLTEAERTASPLGVGDTLPPIELTDLQGAKKQLSSLFGKKLTVLVFWNSRNPYAVEELGDLGPAIVDRFGPFGVNVVGINEREPSDVAGRTLNAAKATFPNLLDTDGQAFAKLATGELPRTYLLDASGKILWFDLEYSRSTRRDLKHAIQYTLLR